MILLVLVFLPVLARGQCSFSVVETAPDDERGYGLDITVSGGKQNGGHVAIYTAAGGQYSFYHFGNALPFEPVNLFYPLTCLFQPGDFVWEAYTFCQTIHGDGRETEYDDDRSFGPFSVGNPKVFEARVLDPPAAGGNVEVKYDFPASSFQPVIQVVGVPEKTYFVTGVGSLTLELPPGTSRLKASWCRTAATERTRFITIDVPFEERAEVVFGVPPSDRVLIAKHGPEAYPSPLQTADSRVRVEATVRTPSGAPVPGKTIYFRVLDPEDAAPYVRNAGDARAGDNSGAAGTVNGGPVGTAVSDATGRVSVVLGVGAHSGDNYRLEATANSGFDCSASPCTRSAVFTAWRRAYIELYKMFRRGAFLTRPAPAGATELHVADTRNLPNTFRARLIHAPPLAGSGDFDQEEVTVARVVRERHLFGPEPGRLLLDPVLHSAGLRNSYSGPEIVDGTPRPYLADAIGVITGNRAEDYYLPNGSLVRPLLAGAFVDIIWWSDAVSPDLSGATVLPFDAAIPWEERINFRRPGQREWMTRKWMRSGTRAGENRTAKPNHQMLFAAAAAGPPDPGSSNKGETQVAGGFSESWIYVESLRAGNELAEATAHEIAHLWRVNQTTPAGAYHGGHCGEPGLPPPRPPYRMASGERMCIMTHNVFETDEGRDGIVDFHYFGTAPRAHSEYLTIRRRPEPIPQNERTRARP